jgi:hypothetical protein
MLQRSAMRWASCGRSCWACPAGRSWPRPISPGIPPMPAAPSS